jgi:sulfite dehydrogenase (quinone) subunit SoeA
LVLPDTTYLERWDCISLLDRPIGGVDGPGDAIRQPVLTPGRDVRPFQDVLIDLGARLGLPGFVAADGQARYLGGYPDYIVNHERRPGVGSLRGWRGAQGDQAGRGAPNPHQLERYVANGCFWKHRLPADQLYFKHANKAYLENAAAMGFIETAVPIVLQLYVEPLQRFRLAAHGHGRVQPPETHRERIATYFDPLPFWYMPFEEERVDRETFPLHALTQRPMHMYHSWHSQNAWLRQIIGHNRLFVNRAAGRALGLAEDDWAWVSSHHGRIRVPTRLMDGVNPDTVWTWNAIAKRAGAWNLDPDAPEFRKGFLLNHLISELLPADGGYHFANADPITGQAAWYDLRVRIERAAPIEAGTSAPSFAPLAHPQSLPRPLQILRYGGRDGGNGGDA